MFHKILKFILETPFSFGLTVASFLALIIVRMTIEITLFSFPELNSTFILYEFTHLAFLSLFTLFLFLPLIRYLFNISFQSAVQLILMGFIVMPLPPVLDRLILKDQLFWSFYEFDGLYGLGIRFLTFFGDTPTIGITYGPRIVYACMILALMVFTFGITRKWSRTLIAGIGSYTILFFIGTLPSWLTLLFFSFQKSILAISRIDVAALFLSPIFLFSRHTESFDLALNIKMSLVLVPIVLFCTFIILWRLFPKILYALFQNARLPQVIYHIGLITIGILLGINYTQPSLSYNIFELLVFFSLIASVVFAWLASVIVNDFFDIKTDQISNRYRPLVTHTISPSDYRTWGFLFFFFSLLLGALVNFQVLFLLLGYQALAWIYSAPPLRLKRIPGLATLLAAVAALFILFAGYITVNPAHDLTKLPLVLVFFLLMSYATSVISKDFKDIAGDAAEKVYTFPVLLGERKTKLLICSFIFLLFVYSPFILNARNLFFPALLFASLAFWAVQKGNANESSFFSYRKLPGILLSVTLLYGIIITFSLF